MQLLRSTCLHVTIHHYLKDQPLAFQWSVNILTVHPHWITTENRIPPRRVQGRSQGGSVVDNLPLHCARRNHYQLVPSGLIEWLHSREADGLVAANNDHLHRESTRGWEGGIPWLAPRWGSTQRQLGLHSLPTLVSRANLALHFQTKPCTECVFYHGALEMEGCAWECPKGLRGTEAHANAMQAFLLHLPIDQFPNPFEPTMWASAIKSTSFHTEHLPNNTQSSPGVQCNQCNQQVIDESISLWKKMLLE